MYSARLSVVILVCLELSDTSWPAALGVEKAMSADLSPSSSISLMHINPATIGIDYKMGNDLVIAFDQCDFDCIWESLKLTVR